MDMAQKLMKMANKNGSSDFFSELTEADKETGRLTAMISNEIFRARKQLGLTQTGFAKMLGVTQPMVSQWESGEYNFTIEMIAKIFSALGTDIELDFSNGSMGYMSSYQDTAGQTGKTLVFVEAA